MLPEGFLQHIILCDTVVRQRLVPLWVQRLVDGLCAQFGGLKHTGTRWIMHNTCCTCTAVGHCRISNTSWDDSTHDGSVGQCSNTLWVTYTATYCGLRTYWDSTTHSLKWESTAAHWVMWDRTKKVIQNSIETY